MRVSDEKLKKATDYFMKLTSFQDYLDSKGLLKDSVTTSQGVAIPCPFHMDYDPSMKIDYSRNLYKCFACGEHGGGNVISFMSNYETKVLGSMKSYSQMLDYLLKSNRQAVVDLGFNSVLEDDVNLNSLRLNGFKRIKITKKEPTTFLELANYIKTYGSPSDKIDAIKLMQDGFSSELIYDMMYKKKKDSLGASSNVFDFSGVSLEDLLRED